MILARVFPRVAVIPIALGLLSAGCSGDTAVSGDNLSTFDQGAEGWTISGDVEEGETEPTFLPSGGTPGGAIQGTDEVAGGTWYFEAPASFLEALSRAYGGSLAFDLRTSETTAPFDDADVVLVARETTLTFNLPSDPAADWTHYEIPLSEAAGWILSDPGEALTAQRFRDALSNTSGLRIRGEYNVGPDTGALDNARITAAG